MKYRIYGLEKMKSPVVLKTAAGEREFHNGIEAEAALPDRRYRIASICARESKLIVELVENRGFPDVAWTDRPVNLFDGD